MYLSAETILNAIQCPKEYLVAIVVVFLSMLVIMSVTKSNKRNEAL